MLSHELISLKGYAAASSLWVLWVKAEWSLDYLVRPQRSVEFFFLYARLVRQ
jgi:hypothetical protein